MFRAARVPLLRCSLRLFVGCKAASTSTDRIVRSRFPNVAVPSAVTYQQHVYSKFAQYGDNTAIVDGVTGRQYSYSQLQDLTIRVASGLCMRGFSRGDTLCILMTNCPEYPLALFGTVAAGGVVTTANPNYTATELAYQLKDSGATYIIVESQSVETVKEATLSMAEKIKGIFVVDIAGTSDIPHGCNSFSELLDNDGSAAPSQTTVSPGTDIAVLPYSSGTTGMPKGVMLSHNNLTANLCQATADNSLTKSVPDERVWLAAVPFFHIYGLNIILGCSLFRGYKIVSLPKFEPESFLHALQEHKVAYAPLVPPIILFLAKHPLVDDYDFSHLKVVTSGAAPLSAELSKEAEKRIGKNIIRQGYGLTETSPATHLSPREGWKQGSVGLCMPNTECKVIHIETGETLGPSEEGEICIRGPQVMMGYLHNPEATSNTIDSNGWLHTGDVGYYDEEEHFYITDRVKELIKVKGLQVAPAELEALLTQHPDIVDAAVVGVADERAGEVPRAFVVQRTGALLTGKQVEKFISERVSQHKQLAGGVQFVDVISKSASGKILRRLLRGK